jgi:hypothetical protein
MLIDQWAKSYPSNRFLLRFAVTEAESWCLADKAGFATAFSIPENKIPEQPDDMSDPKCLILSLVRRSRNKLLRNEMVSDINPNKKGSGYNLHLCNFVKYNWNVHCAKQNSPSLERACSRLQAL